MNREHLDENDIAALVCGEAREAAAAHSSACPECAARVLHCRALLRDFGAAAAQSAECSEVEWLRQRSRILANARVHQHRSAGWHLALATLVLLAAAIGLVGIPTRVAAPPVVAHHAPAVVDPNALLSAVAEELDQQSPDALAPAALFVERDQVSSAGLRSRAGNRQGERND